MNPRSHIFISYARSDGEALARQIHQRLEDGEHLACWRDRLDLEGGEVFWGQLEAGIAAARWMLVVLTPGALQSEWTAREWREARKRGVPICPVWPLEARELATELERSALPAGMQRSHVYTPFPTGDSSIADSEEWRNLTATLRVEREGVRALFMAPPLPPDYVDRPAEVEATVTSLLSQAGGPTTARATALRGAGGMGKTTLAKAVAHRDEVLDAFYDGVLWVTLGTQPKLVEIVADLCRALRDQDVHFSELGTAESHLRALLENRRCLLIVDDVWRLSDMQPFVGLGPSVTTLVTTRIAEVARAAGEAARIRVDSMSEDQAALVLLTAIPNEHRRRVETRCRELTRRLDRWPLQLRLAGGQLRAQFDFGEQPETALDWIDSKLRGAGVTALGEVEGSSEDFKDPRRRDLSVATSIGGSLALLGAPERQAFLALGVFPEDVAVPLATAAQLWHVPDAKETALKLANLSLIDLQLGTHPSIRIHDQILSYAAHRLVDDGHWAESHQHLLDAWKDPSTPPDDYAWRWVCHHLKEAGREDRLIDLLFNYEALARRLAATSVGIDRLVSDYGLIEHLRDAAHVRQALRRAAHILVRRPDLLAQQLVGRITLDSAACHTLLATARVQAPRQVLLPRTQSLASRGSVLRQVVRHVGSVGHLALTGDGRVVTGGSIDGRVYCARLDEGGEPVLLAQHDGAVMHLALTADGRVVTGGIDGRVYCARLDEGGQPVLLARHDRSVTHLAVTADGRVVTAGHDGWIYGTPLAGGEPVRLAHHDGWIIQLALTADGHVVTGGSDGRVYSARLEGGDVVTVAQFDDAIVELALTGDGRVVTGGRDGRVYCARLEGGEPVLLAHHEDAVRQIVLTADGRVVTAGGDGRVFCARLDGGAPVTLAHYDRPVRQLTLTADGRVVTAGADGRVYCVRLDGSEPPRALMHDDARVWHIALTSDGRVVAGDSDGRVYCARLGGGEPIVLARHSRGVSRLALTADGHVMSGADDGRVFCTPLEGGEPVTVAHHDSWITQLALTADGLVVTGGTDGRVYCARLGGREPGPIGHHDASVSRLSLTADGRIVTGDDDGWLYCVPLSGGEPVLLAHHDGKIRHLELTADGRVMTGADDGRVYCARLNGSEPVLLAHHDGWIVQLALTADERVVTSGSDGRVYCARLEGGEAVMLADHGDEVRQLALTADGRVVTGGGDGRVICARLEGGEPITLVGHEGAVTYLVLTADGRVVSGGGGDNRVYCSRLDGGEPVLLARHDRYVRRLDLTADGRVVSRADDGRVYGARLDGGEPVLLAQGDHYIEPLVLTADGRVVIGGDDGWVYVARLEDGERVPLAHHAGEVTQLALTADGRVVTGGRDGRVYCARLDAGGEPVLLAHHDSWVTQLVLTADGRVITGGTDGRVGCARLEGGQPVLLAHHTGVVQQLALTADGQLLSTGTDAALFVIDLATTSCVGMFMGDLELDPIAYDAAQRIVVAGDASGSLHILPLGDRE